MLEVILWIMGYCILGAVFTGIVFRKSQYLDDGLFLVVMILFWPILAVMLLPIWIIQQLINLTRYIGNIRGK